MGFTNKEVGVFEYLSLQYKLKLLDKINILTPVMQIAAKSPHNY